MPPEERDPAYLWDMLDAAREVQRFMAAVRLEEYMQDPMRQRAIERTIEILGEAARNVSETFQARIRKSRGVRSLHSAMSWPMSMGGSITPGSGPSPPCTSPT
jgi:hypothetical protein